MDTSETRENSPWFTLHHTKRGRKMRKANARCQSGVAVNFIAARVQKAPRETRGSVMRFSFVCAALVSRSYTLSFACATFREIPSGPIGIVSLRTVTHTFVVEGWARAQLQEDEGVFIPPEYFFRFKRIHNCPRRSKSNVFNLYVAYHEIY